MLRCHLTVILFAGTAFGCTSDVPEARSTAPRWSERDSAGIHIVHVSGEFLGDVPTWNLADTSLLSIGQEEGPEPYTFGSIIDATWLDDGRIAVVDGRAQEIRIFGPDGRFDRTLGGRGGGPGEFQQLRVIGAIGDGGIAAWDRMAGRATIFDGNGQLEREWTDVRCRGGGFVMTPACRVAPAGFFMDESALQPDNSIMAGMATGEYSRATFQGVEAVVEGGVVRLGILSPTGFTLIDSVAQGEQHGVRDTDGKIYPMAKLYGGVPAWAVKGQWAAWGNSARPQINLRRRDGSRHRILRLGLEVVPVDEARIDSLRAIDWRSRYNGGDDWPGALERWFEHFEAATHVPFFQEIMLGAGGQLWLQDYHVVSLDGRRDVNWWTVFSDDLRPLARIEIRGLLLDVKPGAVLIRTEDSLGVHSIEAVEIEQLNGKR